jgi:hypothetical protein
MLGSVTAEDGALAGIYGDDRGSTAPSSFDAALYVGDPTASGVEVAGTGYAAVTIANTTANFGTPSGGQLGPIVIDFGTGNADWGTPDHWALKDGSGNFWNVQAIASPAAIATGDPVSVSATISAI